MEKEVVQNLEDQFLRKKKGKVRLILINGYQMEVTILNHDDSVIICEEKGTEKMVYKQVISTIS